MTAELVTAELVTGAAFELGAPGRIIFRAGALADLGPIAQGFGRRALVVAGRSPARAATVIDRLAEAGVQATPFSVAGEPTLDTARAGVGAAQASACDLVVGVGGGSVLDAAKAIAALLGNGGDPLDYLEVIGRGRPLQRPSLPLVAVPTTAGTGSEVTRNAVLASPQHGVKASLRSPFMLPSVALIDPDLLEGLPAAVIASSGLDALSQLIEPLLSTRANPITDGLARIGIARSVGALRPAYEAARAGTPVAAAHRESLALASLLGGLCLASAGLGAVHGFAAPLGGMFSAPHGAVCAALLAPAMRVNAAALRARAPGSPALARLVEIAALLTGNEGASAEEGADWVAALARALDVPKLADYGLTEARLPELVEKARAASSMKSNPLPLSDAELTEIARAAL